MNHFSEFQNIGNSSQMNQLSVFDEKHVLKELKHYLPAQAPLKDFIHHNTLHAFQDMKFHEALRKASVMFGYNTTLSIEEYREIFKKGEIERNVIESVVASHVGLNDTGLWVDRMLTERITNQCTPRIGGIRSFWKKEFQIDLDSLVHPVLFRTVCSYLDQGVSIWSFPVTERGFLNAIREIEQVSASSLFKGKRVSKLLCSSQIHIEELLDILIGDSSKYADYLFDQQFAHQGWSGMVATIESQPETLFDRRQITLHDLILFELLLEIDALDHHFSKGWKPLCTKVQEQIPTLFGDVPSDDYHQMLWYWQEAYEWSFYDQVLAAIQGKDATEVKETEVSFQSIFCIDDRECSLRRYLEDIDPNCATFGTPGFFGVEFYFQPQGGHFTTKLCPAPVFPKHLIKEIGGNSSRQQDIHFSKHSHSFIGGWLISQTLGFWSALRLFVNIFRPSLSPAAASSFQHMDKQARLTIEAELPVQRENDLQLGFTIIEMTDRVDAVLKSIGLVKDFAPLVYVVGHGASSINNPHYAAYDCGACSGRAGSVNARVFCYMANHKGVRLLLHEKGIDIPESTRFIGALHDTTRDEIQFFDEKEIHIEYQLRHEQNKLKFEKSLGLNARERSRRFEYINTSDKDVHRAVKQRSVSLFEPRPELNHATNALCLIGRRNLTKGIFLDRRAFLNSYNYELDLDGKYLLGILKAATPVCGGINLEYYFSRVDNQKLGAGTKLPHNVMGLFGVANGIDGDLRPGLPSQMIEIHDPIRLLMIVEHFVDVVLSVLQNSKETFEWFNNEWVILVVVNPVSKKLEVFKNGRFEVYNPIQKVSDSVDLQETFRLASENIPVQYLN